VIEYAPVPSALASSDGATAGIPASLVPAKHVQPTLCKFIVVASLKSHDSEPKTIRTRWEYGITVYSQLFSLSKIDPHRRTRQGSEKILCIETILTVNLWSRKHAKYFPSL
jgi:hypothetical protein